MATSGRQCVRSPDEFCYICGDWFKRVDRRSISDSTKRIYFAYFGLRMKHLEKPWVPHNVCKWCPDLLQRWEKGSIKKMPFGVPTMWREPKSHIDDCYFCLAEISHGKQEKVYPAIPSVSRPFQTQKIFQYQRFPH